METSPLKPPVSVTFIATYICNIVCEHCDLCRFREKELATHEVRSMLEELSGLGVRSVTFEGGEPLTRPDIGKLISFCRAAGMKATLVTNGTLLTRNFYMLGGLDCLVVRINWADGLPDGRGVYESGLEAIGAAKKGGLDVAASVLLTKANIRALPAIIADCAGLGVRLVFTSLSRQIHSSGNSRVGSFLPDEDDLHSATRQLAGRDGTDSSLSADFQTCIPSFGVASGGSSFVITPSGAVASCKCLLTSKKWPNGFEFGFRAAFAEAEKSRCQSMSLASGRLDACNG